MLDLQLFCETDGPYLSLTKPFVRAGWRYATDRRIMVRVPAAGIPDEPIALPRKDMDGFDPFERFALFFENSPSLARVQSAPWPSDIAMEQTNDFCMRCAYDRDLPEDEFGDTIESKSCPVCHGKHKKFLQDYRCKIDGHYIATRYHSLIDTLPNARYLTGIQGIALPFVFDGGQGIVMGIKG